MPLDRIPGEDELYIGGVSVLDQPQLLDAHSITHILSVLQSYPSDKPISDKREWLCVDVDDVEEEDFVVHFPRCVRFIESGLRGSQQPKHAADTVGVQGGGGTGREAAAGAVYVHCAMGKSRSATAVVAYLLWRYPALFRPGPREMGDAGAEAEADEAVARALALVREARPTAEPNEGFMRQLALWWRIGRPADTDDAVERHPAYQRWAYHKDVQESVQLGRAPDRLWFGDEQQAKEADGAGSTEDPNGTNTSSTSLAGLQLRCKKCRRVLAEPPFIQEHSQTQPQPQTQPGARACPHYFVEPLSWMRPVLAEGALEGRLACPNTACGALLGRYAWQGFQCSCRTWVCPAFSLQRSKVDQVVRAGSKQEQRAAAARFGIRLPPGRSSIISSSDGGSTGRAAGGRSARAENL